MFTSKPTDKSALESEIDNLLTRMAETTRNTQQYEFMTDQLVKLYSIEDKKSKRQISPDTLLVVAANLLGIVLIIHHERVNVISSKALNFVQKLQ